MNLRSLRLRALAVAAALSLSAGLAMAAFAETVAPGDHASPPPARLTVVELFTSQGCAACPPADALLGDLAGRSDVLALGYHVDYWDYIGWRDPFADPANTRRQEAYAERLGIPYVFTPQIVVDGAMVGSGRDRREIDDYIRRAGAIEKPWVNVALSHVANGQVRITLPATDYRGDAEILLVRFDEVHRTSILEGENGGRRLTNFHVVRQVRPLAMWSGQPLDLTVPVESINSDSPQAYAVLVQEPDQGRIIGATQIGAGLSGAGPR